MTWIEKVVSSTSESESPEKYWYWAAVAAISAVVRKNVYLDRFYYKLYPNVYVINMGKSGLRKGNPVSLAKNLVAATKATRVISGRNSTPAVLKELGRAYTLETGEIVSEAHAFLCTGELSSFMVKDNDGMTILTDLFDTHAHDPEWKNTLKTGGIDTLKGPCITLLAASNEAHFFDVIPDSDIKGGFIARTFIVHADQKRCINPLTRRPQHIVPFDDLARDLKELSKLKGEFRFEERAMVHYEDWYTVFSNEDSHDPTGTNERLHDNILKVAMVLAMADTGDLVLQMSHIKEAIERCEECISGTRKITMGAGKSPYGNQTALVLKFLLIHKEATRRKLLQRFWGEFDAYDLDRIIETLTQSGAIDVYKVGPNLLYKVKQATLDAYTRFKTEIN